MHFEGLRENGAELAARLLAGYLVRYMTADVRDGWLEASARLAHFAAYSTRQISSVGTRARDQVHENVVLVAFHVSAERQPAKPARPADGFVDLDVRQKLVARVRVERALVAGGQVDSVLFDGVRSQTSAVAAVAAAHPAAEPGRAHGRQRAAQLIVEAEILRLESRELGAVFAEELAVAAHVREQSQRAVGGVAADAAVVLLARRVHVEHVPAQVPQVPRRVAAPQAAERPVRIRLQLHVGPLDVLEERADARLGVSRRRLGLRGGVAARRRELADHFSVVGDVRMEADEVLAYLLAARELQTAHVALVRLHFGVDTGTVAPQVVQVVRTVTALLTLVARLRRRLAAAARRLPERQLVHRIG